MKSLLLPTVSLSLGLTFIALATFQGSCAVPLYVWLPLFSLGLTLVYGFVAMITRPPRLYFKPGTNTPVAPTNFKYEVKKVTVNVDRKR